MVTINYARRVIVVSLRIIFQKEKLESKLYGSSFILCSLIKIIVKLANLLFVPV